MENKNLSGYVLAGGKSSRMQKNKAFLEIEGETFLERAVKTLKEACEDRVKIVLNQSQTDLIAELPDNVSAIFDVYENCGAPGAIHAALKDCRTKYAVILAVDLPFVTSRMITKMAEINGLSNKFLAVVPRLAEGEIQPLCAVYHARFALRTLEQLLNENKSASVRDFLDLMSTRYVDQSKISENEDEFFNVNYPADYQKIR